MIRNYLLKLVPFLPFISIASASEPERDIQFPNNFPQIKSAFKRHVTETSASSSSPFPHFLGKRVPPFQGEQQYKKTAPIICFNVEPSLCEEALNQLSKIPLKTKLSQYTRALPFDISSYKTKIHNSLALLKAYQEKMGRATGDGRKPLFMKIGRHIGISPEYPIPDEYLISWTLFYTRFGPIPDHITWLEKYVDPLLSDKMFPSALESSIKQIVMNHHITQWKERILKPLEIIVNSLLNPKNGDCNDLDFIEILQKMAETYLKKVTNKVSNWSQNPRAIQGAMDCISLLNKIARHHSLNEDSMKGAKDLIKNLFTKVEDLEIQLKNPKAQYFLQNSTLEKRTVEYEEFIYQIKNLYSNFCFSQQRGLGYDTFSLTRRGTNSFY